MWTDVDTWQETYRGKIVVTKSINSSVNFSQRRRGVSLLRDVSKVAKQVVEAEGFSMRLGRAQIHVLGPFMHGDEKLGYVVGVLLSDGETAMVYLPDQAIEDPNLRLDAIPEAGIYVVGGPATYLGKQPKHASILLHLCKHADLFILAHHTLRDLSWRRAPWLSDCKVRTYAELLGREPILLEAMRRELYQRYPPPNDWISIMKGRPSEITD